MNCVDVKKYLNTYIDGELDAGLIVGIENHFVSIQHKENLYKKRKCR